MSRLTPAATALSGLIVAAFRLNGLALAAGDRLTAPAGLTSARWQVLGVVGDAPATASQVARVMGLTRQSVQLTADALERDGFVAWADNPHHRRAKLIAVTAAGARALREVESRHAAWAARLARRLPLESLKAAVKGLEAACAVLEADVESESEVML